MVNIFQPVPDDQSIVFLGQLFGGVGAVLPGMPGILGAMFKIFNTIVLTVGAFIVVYTIIMGLIVTAHEGEFLGKKWHGLWTPMRMVIGIAALVPTPSGYSSLQVIILWAILQGVGAADNLWTTALKWITVTGSPYTAVKPSDDTLGPTNKLKQIFQGVACTATAAIPYELTNKVPKFYCFGKGCGDINQMITTTCPANSSNTTAAECTYNFGPETSLCGHFTYSNPNKEGGVCSQSDDDSVMNCAIYKAQGQAIEEIIRRFKEVARYFAKADYDYLNFFTTSGTNSTNSGKKWGWIEEYCSAKSVSPCCRKPNPAFLQAGMLLGDGVCKANYSTDYFYDPGTTSNASANVVKEIYAKYGVAPNIGNVDFIGAATALYAGAIGDAIGQVLQGRVQNEVKFNADFERANKSGWIFAGAFYYILSKQTNDHIKAASPPLTFSEPKIAEDTLKDYRNNYIAAIDLMAGIESNAKGGGFNAPTQGTQDKILGALMDASTSCFSAFRDMLFPDTRKGKPGEGTPPVQDPLVQLQKFGSTLLQVATILFPIIIAINIAAGVLASLASFQFLGTGFSQGGGPALIATASFLSPIVLGFMAMVIALGGLLSVYVPLIPYMIFLVGAVGWLGSAIEALVAAPLVALGILSPSGQHEILGKSENALMLLFAIILRPVLMIFGLIAAMLLAAIAVKMINVTFAMVMTFIAGMQVDDKGNPVAFQGISIIQFFIFLTAYVFFVVSVLNKCFALIHIIPTRVMAWIGGQGTDYGEEGVLQETRHATEGAGTKIGAAAGVGEQMGAGAAGGQKAKAQQKELEEKQKKPPGGIQQGKDEGENK